MLISHGLVGGPVEKQQGARSILEVRGSAGADDSSRERDRALWLESFRKSGRVAVSDGMNGREGDDRTCRAAREHDIAGVYPELLLVLIQVGDRGEKILDSDLLGQQEPVHSLQCARESLADFVILHPQPVVYRHDREAIVIEEFEPLGREIVLPLSANKASAKEIYYGRF